MPKTRRPVPAAAILNRGKGRTNKYFAGSILAEIRRNAEGFRKNSKASRKKKQMLQASPGNSTTRRYPFN
jgi:hypothetical protein